MKKFFTIFICFLFILQAQAQLDDLLDGTITKLLNKKSLLSVKKGFSPRFSLGNLPLNKVGILGEQLKGVKVLGNIFNTKRLTDITKLYNTYKKGLIAYKVLAGAGTALTTYSTIRGLADAEKFNDKTVRQILTPAISAIVTGVVAKILTKKAAYKAVDVFNGVVKKKLKDILNIGASSQSIGLGLYVKL